MVNLLKLFIKSQQKCFREGQLIDGFTLIELLVAMILAFLVLTPLFGFMFNIVDTDRKEQAKGTSEQEIQSALNYIAQDLEQAVYIYDADGLDRTSTTDPSTSGIKNQIPPGSGAITGCQSAASLTCLPVLVFWKREPRPGIFSVTGFTTKNDAFVYSLVAYYLVTGNSTGETWSNAARIARFQIRDGTKNPNTPTNADGTPNYIETPHDGFKLFDLTLTGTSLKEKLNRWKKASSNYTEEAKTLVDFIDQSTLTPDCSSTSTNRTLCCPTNMVLSSTNSQPGFYACVNSTTNVAQVYIRGNALSRLGNTNTYSNNLPGYFPTAHLQVKGRGLLGFD